MKHQVCRNCSELKEISLFKTKETTKNGKVSIKRDTRCIACHNEYHRTYLKNNKKHQERVIRRKRKIQLLMDTFKITIGCQACGYNKLAGALCFHHINREHKSFEIGWARLSGLSTGSLQQELDKCILVCANCHAEIENGITTCPNVILPIRLDEFEYIDNTWILKKK